MSDPNPNINEQAVVEAIKTLLIKGASATKRGSKTVDDDIELCNYSCQI